MRIGVYQFASTNNIDFNLEIITKAISLASESKVKLLVFQECALCGYPPIESKIEKIAKTDIENALLKISTFAKENKMFVAVGTVRFEDDNRYNSIVVFNDNGDVMGYYDKMALWGWDTSNFRGGTNIGVFNIDDTRVGFRICYDIRFPELFRDLYKQNTDICFVSFCDTSETSMPDRYDIIKAHLITRAVENVMTVVSVNSITNFQTAPTAVFDCNGDVVKEAEINVESLLLYDYTKPEPSFATKGRIENSNSFLKIHKPSS